jgi:hypothetical protein
LEYGGNVAYGRNWPRPVWRNERPVVFRHRLAIARQYRPVNHKLLMTIGPFFGEPRQAEQVLAYFHAKFCPLKP